VNEKADAIAHVRGSYKELELIVRDLPEDRMMDAWYGDWSTKDLLAHLASWDEYATADLQRVQRGHIPCLASFNPNEINQWNEFFMKPRRSWPLVQVRFESHHSHEGLIDVLNALPETMFGQGLVPAYCRIASEHYREHGGNIAEHHHQQMSEAG
jgi:hypothetical protein